MVWPEPNKTVRYAHYGPFFRQLPTSDQNLVEDKVVRLEKTKNFPFIRFSIWLHLDPLNLVISNSIRFQPFQILLARGQSMSMVRRACPAPLPAHPRTEYFGYTDCIWPQIEMIQKPKLFVSIIRTTFVHIIFSFEVILISSLFEPKSVVNTCPPCLLAKLCVPKNNFPFLF